VAGRALGPDAYGLVAALQSIVVVASLPVVALQWSIARVVAGSDEGNRASAMATYRRALIRGSVIAMGMALLATLVTLIIDLAGQNVPLVPLIITYSSVAAMVPLLLACGALQGAHRYTGLAWSYASSGVLRAPLLLLLLSIPFLTDVDGAVLSVGVAIAIGAIWAMWLTRRDLAIRERPPRDTWLDFLSALPAVMVGLTGIAMLSNIDVVAAKLSIGGEQAGLFGAASVVAKALLVVPQALTLVLLPRVAEREARGQRTGSLLAAGILVMAVAGALAMLICIPLAEPIMHIAFGAQFTSASTLLIPFFGATTLLGALLILVNHHVARSDHRFVWAAGGLAVLQVVLLIFFATSSTAIIAIDAIVAGVGLVVHEMMYFNTDESMLRGAGVQCAMVARKLTRRDGNPA
jgi:O-antigen/teichoic acid export membrane protein